MAMTREERAEKNKAKCKRQRAEKREYLNKVKLEKGCEICGYRSHPAALHFDHIDPATKSFGIGDTNRGWELMFLEIEKCRILCANCHAIHTTEEKHHLLFMPKQNKPGAIPGIGVGCRTKTIGLT